MSRRIRVLSSEHGPSAEDTFSSTSNLKLLVKLRRLGKESLLAKVSELEDIGTALRGSTDETRRFKLFETLTLEVRAEELLHLGTDILHHV